jgi:signal transduction histidine kinase
MLGASIDVTELMEKDAALRQTRAALENEVIARATAAAHPLHSQWYRNAHATVETARALAHTTLQATQLSVTPRMVESVARLAASTALAAENALEQLVALEERREREWLEAVWMAVRRAIATSEEEQRRRISRELHDQLGQQCASLLIGLGALRTSLPDDTPTAKRLVELVEIARRLDDDLHRIALELRPTALDDLGLEETLLNLVETWAERSQIVVDYRCEGLDKRRLSPDVETAVFRIVQEALTNIHKHAHASRVGLILRLHGDELVVIVEDDGVGFDLRQMIEPEKLGVRGIRERAALVGGALEIEASPGGGTTVHLRIPLAGGAGP